MMTIRPGYGIEHLHLGESKTDISLRLGMPEKKSVSGKLREYWRYIRLGVECVVSRNTGRVLSLFFTAAAASLEGSSGIASLFGASRQEIQEMFAEPELKGGGFHLDNGAYIGEWFSYDRGIGFHFDREGHVEKVAIFRRKQKSARRSTATQRTSGSRQIAALRKR